MYLVILVGLIAAYVAFVKSPQKALLNVYFPVLFLVPDYYRWVIAGLPDPTFSEAAILPIALVFLIKGAPGWRFTLADGLVVGFAFCEGLSQYLATGYGDAQNLIFDMLGVVILPYVLAKALIEPSGLRVQFAKRLIVLLSIVAVTEVYEFRMVNNLFKQALGPFFPWQGEGWVNITRNGYGRAAGPYGHPILCGIVMGAGFRLQRWLQQGRYWASVFRARLLTLSLLVGMALTQSRGPWLGAILGSAVVLIGRAQDRRATLITVLAVTFLVGVPAYQAFNTYVSVGRAGATSEEQETAAYRKELVDRYTDIALERPTLGWGQNEWPRIPGMPSIDNHFLGLALRHGFITVGFFVLILVSVAIRLTVYCYKTPRAQSGSALGFTLLAVLIGVVISITTVYLGLQAQQLLFMFVGWTEGLVKKKEQPAAAPAAAALVPGALRFRRVLT